MAAIGSAVGLGNIWRFPYLAGENGGSAFLLIYVAATLAMAMPVLIAELALGRMGGGSPIGSLRHIVRENCSSRFWELIGILATICAFLVLSYYCVIGGWTLRYVYLAIGGSFAQIGNAGSYAMFTDFMADPMAMISWHLGYMLLNVVIALGGLRKGIEKTVVVLMPLLFVLLFAMVIYGATMPGFATAVDFLFTPDFSKLTPFAVLSAIGQSFFALSVGLGSMIIYGAYLDKGANIPGCAVIITGADVLVALLSGLAIFPLVFSFALEPSSGPGLLFITLPIAFGQMSGGALTGAGFFLLVSVAALTSSISLLEVVVTRLEERFGMTRSVAAWLVGGVAWALGLVSLLSFNVWSGVYPLAWLGMMKTSSIFAVLDFFCLNLLIPVTALLICLYMGWVLAKGTIRDALGFGGEASFRSWRFCLRFVAPLGIISILAVALLS